MDDADDDRAAEGRTSWRRAAVLLVPSFVAVGAMTLAMAQGVLAASFGVSGSNFKVSASAVEGTNVAGYLDTVRSVDGVRHPVMLAGVERATLHDVCTSAVVQVPVVGAISLQVHSGGDRPVTGTNLVADADAVLGGRGTIRGVEAGRDASTLSRAGVTGPAGRFGVQAASLTSADLKSTAWSANGGTVTLEGLRVSIDAGRHECY